MANSKIAKRSARKVVWKETPIEDDGGLSDDNNSSRDGSKSFVKRRLLPIILLVVLVIGLAGYLLRDKILVAIVNGKPIFRFELNQRLTSTFGKETMENMIVERLIAEEAKKRSISVSESDIDKEVAKATASLGAGVKLEDALSFQGLTLAEFRKQLALRLEVNKILEKDITVSQDEIAQYIKDNAKTLVASSEADKKTEAQGLIMDKKISDKIQTWVSDLVSQAKITRFLK